MFEQSRVFVKLDGGVGDNGMVRVFWIQRMTQFVDELLLVLPLPGVLARIHLQQILSSHAHKPIAQSRRQILRTHRPAVVLVAQRVESLPHVVEERALECAKLGSVRFKFNLRAAQHFLPQALDRLLQ